MPTFEITAPDGRTFEVKGPDGSTKEQALERVRAQYTEQAPKTTSPAKIGAEGLSDAIKQVSEEFSAPSKFAVGAAGWVNSAAMRLKQLLGRDLTPQDLQGIKEYAALNESSGSATAGDIAMNLLATLNPAVKAQQAGAAALQARKVPALLANLLSTGGTAAAVTATTEPITGDQSTAGEAGKSAAIATAADLATRGVARAAQPIIQSEAVRSLTKEGIVPTLGQAAGGFLNRIEQQLESVPVVGWMITGSRGRAVKEMDEAAIKKALPVGTEENIKAGREGIERAGDLIDNAYDAAYAQIKGKVKVDQEFFKDIGNIPQKEGIDLPPSLAQRFDALMKDRVIARLADGADAETLREVQNSIGALARKYRGSADPDQRALGAAFSEAKAEFRQLVAREASGDFKATLDALDKKYSALLSVEKASGYQGSKDGVFSAEALKRASTKSSPEMKDFADTATDVLGRTVPDSGTAGRFLFPLLAGSAATGNDRYGGPEWLTKLFAAGAMTAPFYTRAGSRYMIGDYAWQPAFSQTLRDFAPYVGQASRSGQ